MAKSVLHTIEDNLSTFSKGQKRIGRYILDHYDQAAFMTASKLGKLTEVSESTVVRFAAELGFDLQKSIYDAIVANWRELLDYDIAAIRTELELPARGP